jgi:hypothetical protein
MGRNVKKKKTVRKVIPSKPNQKKSSAHQTDKFLLEVTRSSQTSSWPAKPKSECPKMSYQKMIYEFFLLVQAVIRMMIWIRSYISVDREQISVSLWASFFEIELESKKKMKIILLVEIFCLFLANGLAKQVIICKSKTIENYPGCEISGVTIGKNEAVSIKTDPEDLDVNRIESVKFVDSSIYSVPTEVFRKFPKLERIYADGQNIQEITPDTFKDGKNLRLITLSQNHLTFLHRETFKSEYFPFRIFQHSFLQFNLKILRIWTRFSWTKIR